MLSGHARAAGARYSRKETAPRVVHCPVERVHVNENEDPLTGQKHLTMSWSAEYTPQAVLGTHYRQGSGTKQAALLNRFKLEQAILPARSAEAIAAQEKAIEQSYKDERLRAFVRERLERIGRKGFIKPVRVGHRYSSAI